MNKLYNLNKDEAKQLLEYVSYDTGKLALILWNSGRAATIASGINKAKRLANFIK